MEKNQGKGSSLGLLAVVLVVICFMLSWKLILPEYKTANQEYVSLKEEADAAEKKIAALQETKQQLDSIKPTVDKILVSVPVGKDMPNLVSELEAIAAKHKTYIPSVQSVSANSAQSSEAAVAAAPANHTIAFSAAGSFEDLTGFVKSLETDLRFFNISSLVYSYSEKEKLMTLSVQIDLPTAQIL